MVECRRGSCLGTEVKAVSSPETKGDEVKLMFRLFDIDGDGKVTTEEMKSVLKSLDPKLWTDARVEKVMAAYDTNGDGNLQFTEFWGWVCGHGGKSTDDFKPALLEKATEDDRLRREENQTKLDTQKNTKNERAAEAAEAQRRSEEREGGIRKTRKDYIQGIIDVGITKEVATALCSQGDANNDGEIDGQESQWLAGERAATTQQIRSLYQQSSGGEVDAKGNLDTKALEAQGIDAIVEAFGAWDVNGDGTIQAEELSRVLTLLNPRLGTKTVQALWKEIDLDQDGLIDVVEFVGWLSGESTKKKKMTKKNKEEQEAKLALAMHRKRAEQARKEDRQREFEQALHSYVGSWCDKKKVKLACGKLWLGPGAPQMCTSCGDRHAWLCHGCGFVSFYPECVNGCAFGKTGWSCIDGNCNKKCGCKKKPDFWQRSGKVHALAALSVSVDKIIAAASAPP